MSTAPSMPSALDRLLAPVAECFTVEVAQRIAEVKTDPQTLARLEELREKANRGSLSPAEEAEYDEFIEGLDLLSLLKLKARSIANKSV